MNAVDGLDEARGKAVDGVDGGQHVLALHAHQGAQLAAGGAILRSPRRTLTGLFLPELGSYLARLAIVAVFLGAYGIPVSFHSVATVTASNSISNSVSATPGGVGVTQAMNSAALAGETNAATATAYCVSAVSVNGNIFVLTNNGSTVTRACYVPSGNNRGACPSSGNW